MKAFLKSLIVALLTLGIGAGTSAQVVINEFSAANYDQFWGGGIDWLELYNNTGAVVNLSGYHLSDKQDNPTKWAFPAGTTIGPAQHLLVLLDSELDDELNGELCTNFRITQTEDNEWVVFADPGGNILDSYQITQPNQANHSWGRDGDGNAAWVVYTSPTPESPNVGPNYLGYAPKPVMSLDPGIYAGGINVALSSPEANAVIRYTTNGNFPTAASTMYAGPIAVNANMVIKAMSFSPDASYLPSFTETNTYLIGVSHTLPIVSVSGDEIDDLLNGNGWLDPLTTFEIFTADGVQIDEVDGDSNEHGNDSNAYPQRGFDFIVRDQLGYADEVDGQLFRISDRDKYQRLIMKCAANDNYPFANGAHIRDSYVHSLSQVGDLRMDERSYEPCILYVNGEYWGLYEFREKVDDLDFTDYYYDQPRHYVDFLKTWGGTWVEYGNGADWYTLRDFILGNDMSVQANYETATDSPTNALNAGSLIDYFILNGYVVCMDWLNWNTAWWRGRHPDGDKKKWRYALWDMDATFGHYINYTGIPDTGPTADPCDPETLGDPGGQGHVPILNALFNNEEFTNDYLNRYADLSNSLFSCDFMIHHLDSLIAIIEPEMPGQIQRWGGTMAGWEAEVQELRDFILARCNDEIIGGMEDCYDVEAVTVTIIIEGLGEVQVNTITIDPNDSPFEGVYWSGVPIDLTALESLGGYFINWEVIDGNLVIDDPTNPEITITVDGDVTIVVHFVTELDPVLVMYDVEPAGAGEILVDGNIAGPYPNTVLMDAGVDINLEATPNQWYLFDHWESLNHSFDPDEFSNPTSIMYLSTDTVIAVFTEIEHYPLTVDVFPAGAGTVSMDGVELSPLPFTQDLEAGLDFGFSTAPSGIWYEFSHWELNNNVIAPDEFSTDITLTFTAQDTLIAVYNELEHYTLTVRTEPEGAGVVTMDGVQLLPLPWSSELAGSVDYSFNTAPTDIMYEFSHWEAQNHVILPDEFSTEIMLTLTATDELVAVYDVLPMYSITVKVEPPYSGTVLINDFLPIQNQWTGMMFGEIEHNFKATPAENHSFKNWEAMNHPVLPNIEDTEINMTFFSNDTLIAYFLDEQFLWFVPNSFSPNNDGINDFFLPIGQTFDPASYEMRIYNRWGELVFKSNDPEKPWDGSHENGEYYSKDEVYVYYITVRPANELSPVEFKGHVTVLR